MPNNTNDMKAQRDRFLAFAFAAADLLIEIKKSGEIVYASGAARAITGYEDKELLHKNFQELFISGDNGLISSITDHTSVGSKHGPFLMKIQNKEGLTEEKHIFLSSFSMKEDGPIYIAVTMADALLSFIEFSKAENALHDIPNMKDFEHVLRKKIANIGAGGKAVDVQVLQLDGMAKFQNQLDSNSWAGLTAALGQLMMESSLDGETAVKVDDEKYLLLKDGEQNSEELLQQKIMEIAKQYNIADAIDVKSKNIEGDLTSLSAREATRAVLYTMNKMEQQGLEAVGDDLKGSFSAFLEENAIKISNIKRMISHQDFQIKFQPIVMLDKESVSHHEVLVRFNSDKSPFELITMCEDIGLSPDLDLAICRQCLKYVDQNGRKKSLGKLAVNISGQSIQSEKFVKKLLDTLTEYSDAAKSLMFEITESSEIKDLDKVDGFIQQLRKKGYPVCLDDFGAGAASFQYLHKLQVDGVKIDGAYVRNVLTSTRDATMVKNMTQMCHEMGVYVVAEMIENEDQKDFLRAIGVDKGQGWLFGKAEDKPLAVEK
ncbi:MAG TPA: EAL domain-containing protein [Alphaproteobacteria bacterium]|nr:EAL domain-containing protein [Alphaproteobacteria bacterium]HOO50409.1 EAL domain-containing protein [Alphaproteobacteria bacterium]